MARLGNYIRQVRGVSYKPGDLFDSPSPDAITVLRANNITDDGEITLDDVVWVAKERVKDQQLIKAGDILVCASSGSKNLVGKAAQAEKDLDVAFGAFCKVVRPMNANKKYIGYFFQSPIYRRSISYASAGVNINNIRSEDLDALAIDLPDADEQAMRVNKLEKLARSIALRKKQLDKIDLLIKSQFIETFLNRGFQRVALEKVSHGKGEYGAASASVEYIPSRPRYVRITDINDDGTLNDDRVCSVNLSDDSDYKLEYGDFLFARMGATVGKTYVYKTGNQIFAGYLIRYKLNTDKINPYYLYSYTKTPEYESWVQLNQSGAAQPGINAKKYGSLQIPLPPMALQNQFAAFVEQTDKSKFRIKQSLENLEKCYKALLQKYFG